MQTREQCRTGDEGSQRVPARLDEVIAHIYHQVDELHHLKQALSIARARVTHVGAAATGRHPMLSRLPGSPAPA
ncbi:hypothetical protein [Thiohalophilus sp.]|uniref:hypothetical protein n=1 Tax=Thiohalophilus sp. TaxID=3028392 RepID=UPI003975911F